MNQEDTQTLYIKKGRKYEVWGNFAGRTFGDRSRLIDGDALPVGTSRLTYCPAPGHSRYSYQVNPDHAAFLAAAEVARHAMEEAIRESSAAQVFRPEQYTPEQQAILDRCTKEMREAGILSPGWTSGVAHEVAQAGIDAVRKAAGLLQ